MRNYAGLAGTAVGALIALVGVWPTQRRTDIREAAKWERERVDRDLDRKPRTCAACRRFVG